MASHQYIEKLSIILGPTSNIAIKIDKPGAIIKNFLDVFFRCFNHSDLNIFIILHHLHEQF